ncbi:hypothetical protein RJ640_007171 [Escallonia rubra]|uniref:Transmembrane protein n=1 Tax=Escallonia rubra TaxID=112253 RepID=A0AA88U802_9ASTE|nr:hypothetical protein RJ640_007171 [Escallonia rubra]
MNHHHRPPPVHPRTTAQLLKQTTTIFTSHLLTFLFLSFLLLTFRSNVENGSHFLTSFVDRDPSLKSLLRRLDLSGTTPAAHRPHQHRPLRHRRRRPFLQLTRVGTLDDDFFSGDHHHLHSLFGPLPSSLPNASLVQLGFPSPVADNGIRASQIIHPGFSLKTLDPIDAQEEQVQNDTVSENNDVVDMRFLIKGLEMGRRDATTLVFLVGVLSASYGYVIVGFMFTYSWLLGIVFVAVVNDFLGRYKSFTSTLWDGSYLGFRRLSGFILMKWAVRDALTQLLGIWFFGEIEDQYTFFKIFVRLKLMPFSIASSWVKGYERESVGFLLSWFLLDTLVGFIFSVDAWIAIVDSRKSGREVVKEGCHLLATMLNPAVNIKCLEGVVCGSITRWVLSALFGKLFASAFQSMMEVYFMVAWLVYYLAARSKDANSLGRTFGQREMEGLLEDLR